MAKENTITPEQKAAAVVISLGAEKAAQVYKYLTEDEIQRITIEVAKLGFLPSEVTESILDEFYKNCMLHKVVTEGGMEYARSVLEKAFGEEVAHNLLGKVEKTLKSRVFSFLSKYDDLSIFSILSNERPQTIALVLSYMDSDRAASIISGLPEQRKINVVEAIARMDSAAPEAMKIVEQEIEKKLSSVMTTDYTKIGGIDYIAEVMNYVDRGDEKYIFDELSKKDIELVEEIRKKMFVFEDIVGMDNLSIQRVIREVDQKDLVYALKGAQGEVANVIFANMSARMTETIKSELEITTNVRVRDVEDAQQRVVAAIRKLEDAGQIVVSKGGKDDIIA
ncbi:flagellar motor switch protein FliG [Anaerotignum neopropionicum]|uniref:Flagellar motor switch protein FliG n=1 Tax=Anaerotignum neopropionicum TaxID=36847 RepID=A0A136WIU8_9FIRM|nr:flagellar motor switch protein FliG [Anaerotignum neopropionicum]KXL54498.1 flagellar motor switch protein FliG [Anaerotignum neopropionicum]